MKLYTGFGRTKAGIVLVVAAVYLALMMQSGGSLLQWLLFCVVVLAYVVLPGLFWRKLLRTERFAPGFGGPLVLLLGAGFFVVLFCFAMRLGVLWLLYLLPPLLGPAWAAMCLREGKRPPLTPKPIAPHEWMLMLLFAALLLFFSFYGVVKYALPHAVGDILPNHDLLWNVGNANSFKLAFPPQDIRFVGVRLHYHYLTELLAGALSFVSGIHAYSIMAFYMQPFMLAALVLCAYKFGRVMWPEGLLKPVLFTYTPFLLGCASLWKILPNGWSVFGNSNITHIVTNINGQTTALTFLCMFLGLLIPAMRKKYKTSLVHYILLICAFLLLSFAKGPLAAIVVCSLVITLLLGLLQKNTGWQGLVFGAVCALLFAYVYVTMFSSGANDSMQLHFTETLSRGYFSNIEHRIFVEFNSVWPIAVPILWLLQSFLSMPAQFALYVRALFHDVRHFNRLSAEKMLAHGCVVGGLLAFFLFNHPHMSQIYFLFAALFFANLLAVDGIGYLRLPFKTPAKTIKAKAKKAFTAFVAVCTAVGVVTCGFLYVHYLGSGGRQLLRNMGIIQKYPYDVVITPDDEAAMQWLAQNSPQDAMFATNRIHTGARAEGISNLYSAYCGRQAYMEGFQYAKTNMGVPEEEINYRLAVNTALFSAQTQPQEVVALCQNHDIDYLVYSTQLPGDESQMSAMNLVFDSSTVRIYTLPLAEG